MFFGKYAVMLIVNLTGLVLLKNITICSLLSFGLCLIRFAFDLSTDFFIVDYAKFYNADNLLPD